MLGRTRVVRTLLAAGALCTLPDPTGLLPLHLAAASGRLAATRLLLGAAPQTATAAEQGGVSAGHLAASRGMAAAVSLILDAAPHTALLKTQHGATMLHMAAQQGHDKVVRRERGSVVQLPLMMNAAVVSSAAGCLCATLWRKPPGLDHPQVRSLLEAAPAAALERMLMSGATPLYLACFEGYITTARLLLAAAPQAARIPAGETMQRTPLQAAVQAGHLGIVKLVLEEVPQVALVRSGTGHLPIHFAAVAEHACSPAIVQLLLDAAPATATSTKNGFSPLHYAALHGNAATARLLVQAAPGDAQRAVQIALG